MGATLIFKKHHLLKLALTFFLVTLAVLLNRMGWLERTLDWIEGLGFWGPWVFLAVYAATCVFFVPSFVFTFSAGILFGLWKGFALSIAGTGAGSLAAFWMGRYLVRDFIEKKIASQRAFLRLAAALQERGWKVVILARLSPVFPFWIGNYAFGVTRIRAAHYFFATLVGTMPSALLYTYLGTFTGGLAAFQDRGRSRTAPEWLLLVFGLIATVFLTWYLSRLSEKNLNE